MSSKARAAELRDAIARLDEIMVSVFCIEDPLVDELRVKLVSLLGDAQYSTDVERWMGANDGPTQLLEHPDIADYPKEGWA